MRVDGRHRNKDLSVIRKAMDFILPKPASAPYRAGWCAFRALCDSEPTRVCGDEGRKRAVQREDREPGCGWPCVGVNFRETAMSGLVKRVGAVWSHSRT